MGSWGGIYNEQMVTVLCMVAETAIACKWFGLVSWFNGISTYVGYLMPKWPFWKNSSDAI